MTKKELREATEVGEREDMTVEEFQALPCRGAERERVKHIFMEYRRPVDQRAQVATDAISEAIARLGAVEVEEETARDLLYRVAREKGVAISTRSRFAP